MSLRPEALARLVDALTDAFEQAAADATIEETCAAVAITLGNVARDSQISPAVMISIVVEHFTIGVMAREPEPKRAAKPPTSHRITH